LRDTSKYFNEAAEKENAEGLEAIRKSGKTQIITLTADEKRAWKKVLIPIHKAMADRVGKPLLESIYKETGFDPDKL
jgi:C4-dicarboxylate-binding protein DctP